MTMETAIPTKLKPFVFGYCTPLEFAERSEPHFHRKVCSFHVHFTRKRNSKHNEQDYLCFLSKSFKQSKMKSVQEKINKWGSLERRDSDWWSSCSNTDLRYCTGAFTVNLNQWESLRFSKSSLNFRQYGTNWLLFQWCYFDWNSVDFRWFSETLTDSNLVYSVQLRWLRWER